MDVRHPRSGLVPVARPTTRDRPRDRLSVHHDGPAAPGSEPGGAARGLTRLVLDCLRLLGEVEPTTATSCSDLERWQDRVLPDPGGDTVPVVVVPAGTWALHLAGRPTRPVPGRGVVVVCGNGAEPPAGAWPAVHHVTAVRPGEVPGALLEALAGQTSTVVRVLPG